MIVREIIDRLKAIDPPVFAVVEGIAQLAALKDAPPSTPAAYVFIEREAAGENTRLTGTLQRVEMDIGIVLIAKNVSDTTGAAAIQDIEALKFAARNALLGWEPPSVDEGLILVGGELVRSKGGTVWWQDTLGAAYYLGAT